MTNFSQHKTYYKVVQLVILFAFCTSCSLIKFSNGVSKEGEMRVENQKNIFKEFSFSGTLIEKVNMGKQVQLNIKLPSEYPKRYEGSELFAQKNDTVSIKICSSSSFNLGDTIRKDSNTNCLIRNSTDTIFEFSLEYGVWCK